MASTYSHKTTGVSFASSNKEMWRRKAVVLPWSRAALSLGWFHEIGAAVNGRTEKSSG